jgi:hypothetical protein
VGVLRSRLYKEKQVWLMARQSLLERIFMLSALLLLFLIFSDNVVFSQVYHDGIPTPFLLFFLFIVLLNRHQSFNGFRKKIACLSG